MEKTTTTRYGVARGNDLVGDVLFTNVGEARGRLGVIEQGMRDLDLEPDVRVIEVDVTTSYARFRTVKDDGTTEPEAPDTTPTA